MLATVQDLGRRNVGHLGVSPSGAADWFSARAANRLVGNSDAAALIETTLTGATFVLHGDAWLAVTGADSPLHIGGQERAAWRAHRGRDGDRVAIGAAGRGARSYLAVDGGLIVPLVFGSASTDVTAGFGGRILAPGDEIEIGKCAANEQRARIAPLARDAEDCLRCSWRSDSAAVDALFANAYTVGARSSRQALVLEGGPAIVGVRSDMPSAGVCAGFVQITGDGTPIVLLCEHQTTGGYEIAAVVALADMPVAAQLRPGQHVSFVAADAQTAALSLEERRTALDAERADANGDGGQASLLSGGFFEGVES